MKLNFNLGIEMYHCKFSLMVVTFSLYVTQRNPFDPKTFSMTFSEKSLTKFCQPFPIFRLILLMIINQTFSNLL